MRFADEIGCKTGSQPSLFFSDTSDAQLQAAAAELAQRFHDGLGTHSRRIAYSFLLREPELLFDSFEDNCGRRQTAVMRALWPVIKGACASALLREYSGHRLHWTLVAGRSCHMLSLRG